MNAQSPSAIAVAALVLRTPSALATVPRPRETLARIVLPLLAITLLAGAAFGLVLGSYRGGLQIFYAALKLPVLLLVPLLVCLPAVRALHETLVGPIEHAHVVLAALVGIARTALLAAAVAPVLWLLYSVRIDYHLAVLVMAGTLALAGALGGWTMVQALPRGRRSRWLARLGSLLIVGAVSAQCGWLLRPFVVRPRADITLLRPIEGDVFQSIRVVWDAAHGRYRDWHARPEGFGASRRSP
jgi:hypothetical protein